MTLRRTAFPGRPREQTILMKPSPNVLGACHGMIVRCDTDFGEIGDFWLRCRESNQSPVAIDLPTAFSHGGSLLGGVDAISDLKASVGGG